MIMIMRKFVRENIDFKKNAERAAKCSCYLCSNFFLFVCVNDAIYSLPGCMNQEKKKNNNQSEREKNGLYD
jgi:hypothetical protein